MQRTFARPFVAHIVVVGALTILPAVSCKPRQDSASRVKGDDSACDGQDCGHVLRAADMWKLAQELESQMPVVATDLAMALPPTPSTEGLALDDTDSGDSAALHAKVEALRKELMAANSALAQQQEKDTAEQKRKITLSRGTHDKVVALNQEMEEKLKADAMGANPVVDDPVAYGKALDSYIANLTKMRRMLADQAADPTKTAKTCKLVHQFYGGSYNPVAVNGKEISDYEHMNAIFAGKDMAALAAARERKNGESPWGLTQDECSQALKGQANGVICGAGLAYNIFRTTDGVMLGGNEKGYAIPGGAEGFQNCLDLVKQSTPTHVCVWSGRLFLSAVRISDGVMVKQFQRFQEGMDACPNYLKTLSN